MRDSEKYRATRLFERPLTGLHQFDYAASANTVLQGWWLNAKARVAFSGALMAFGSFRKMRAFRIFWLLAVTVTLTPAAAEPLTRAALIIDESDASGGIPTTFSATLRTTLRNSTPRVAVFGETLDLSRFADPKQEPILRTYIQQKYSDIRFGVIVAVGASVL